MSISNNVRRRTIEGSWIRRMFEEGSLLKKRFGEDNVFDLSIGNPVVEPPPEFKVELRRIANSPEMGMHRYMENAGYPGTRSAVAQQMSADTTIKFSMNDIVMTCGAAGAINVILKTILDQSEEIIVFAPYFLEYDNYIDNHGGVTKVVPTDEMFIPKLDVLEKAITPKTKAVLINTPNNPTGVVYTPEFTQQLGELLNRKSSEIKKNIYLISDEAYSRIVYDGLKNPNIFSSYPQSIVATSHSKDLALPGERIGFIAINPECAEKEDLISGFIFCNRVLGFVNAPALMQHVIRNLQNVTVSISAYQSKRDFLYNSLIEMGYSLIKPQGTFYMFPKSPVEDEILFVRELQEYNILVVPGRSFGTPGFFRISYCVNDKTLEGSLTGFKKAAQKHNLC